MKGKSKAQELTFGLAGLCGICLYYPLENITLTYYGCHIILTIRRIFCYGVLFMILPLFLFDFRLELARFANPLCLFNIIFLGLSASALCFVTWNFAVKASIYIYMVPVITVVTLHEKITALAADRTVLTLDGLLLSESKLFSRKEEKQNGLAK